MNATAKTTKRAVAQRVYQLRISLDEADPSIWRRLWVPGTLTLAKLDLVIQTAMGWTNSHLHEFNIDGRRYGMVDDEWPSDEPVLEDKRHKLDKVLGDVKEFTYTYDFGDNWLHIVTVEQVLAANDMNCWPMCLDGRNACPPEDVGGMGDMKNSVRRCKIPRTRNTTLCGVGQADRLIQPALIATPSTQQSGN